jgi:hypothetical protein
MYESLTDQLRRYSSGDWHRADAVFREVVPKLREITVRQLQRERYAAPCCPSELINEVWLKSLRHGGGQTRDREHFYSIAGPTIPQVLVDAARSGARRILRANPGRLDRLGSAA